MDECFGVILFGEEWGGCLSSDIGCDRVGFDWLGVWIDQGFFEDGVEFGGLGFGEASGGVGVEDSVAEFGVSVWPEIDL